MSVNPIYIIPARGGSKGIPHKNIALLAGEPLIAYTIRAALAVAPAERVIVSTDDDEIAAVSELYGLDCSYRRPPELATDTAGSREVILDGMNLADRRGICYDAVVLLQPTSPFRRPEDINAALALYNPALVDMVVTVTEAASNPYYNSFETDSEGYLHVSKGDGLLTRRQDAPRVWEYNGAVYVINPESIRKMPMGKFPRRIPSPMPRERSIDIDSKLDLLIAEIILKNDCQL
ncbi:MAG: acylneuraminate cytidylyltransferase family protein [Muribaculaceae bacterium]|nr:acylneuraminate cytidylyltransferase family protein [Muribaculaceae bacterium]